MGTEVAGNEAVETVETAENEAEETVEEGSVAVEDEESSTAIEDKEENTSVEAEISEEAAESSEDDSEDDEEEKEEEEDPERLSELEILPGKTAYINFYYTIDPEIEGMKDQKVDFSFAYTLEDEEGKQTKNTLRETFRYAVDALNLMTVTAGGEKGYVETGKEDEMLLEFDLGLMREVLEEAIEEELEKTENGDASAAEAKRASASELLVGWEDENGERPLGKKDPAVIKNLKCEVETFGVKLDKFKAVPVKDDDNFGTSLKCSFYVSRKTLPGTYYGRVNASYKIKGKSFHTTQGFKVVVKQETGELELVGKIGDSEIVMTGPVSSFPKADELSLKVSEITQEQQEKVDEALQKKAEEEGTEINQYKALDIKLMADGVETEPEGDVQVRFKNVNLEKVDENKEAEQEKAEEQSIVKKAVRKVMSLFSARNEEEDVAAVAEAGTEGEEETKAKDTEDVKAEGSEETAGEAGDATENSENIKVLHLDEDAVVANEMKSEVQDNGDVVMDTDHFSIYVVVDMGRPGGYINVTVEHYGSVKTIAAREPAKYNKETGKWEAGDLIMDPNNPSDYLRVDDATDPIGEDSGGYALWDEARYEDKPINGKIYPQLNSNGEILKYKQPLISNYPESGYKISTENEIEKLASDYGKKLTELAEEESEARAFGYHAKDDIYDRYRQEINTVDRPTEEIYTPQTIELPNDLKIDAENLSKVFFEADKVTGEILKKEMSARSYEISQIHLIIPTTDDEGNTTNFIQKYKVTHDMNGNMISVTPIDEESDTTSPNSDEKSNSTSLDSITLTSNCTVRFIYKEKTKTAGKDDMVYHNVTFYDHNVTNGGKTQSTAFAGNEGINNSSKFKGKKHSSNTEAVPRMESGQYYSGNGGIWNHTAKDVNINPTRFYGVEGGKTWTSLWHGKELNSGNKMPARSPKIAEPRTLALPIRGLVKSELQGNVLQFDDDIAHPDFFLAESPSSSANKLIEDYKLGFKKEGDTYTLSKVVKKDIDPDHVTNDDIILSNLENIRYSTYGDGVNSALFSNEFWPLDKITSYDGMDSMRPGESDGTLGTNIKHNWHFGMNYNFEFTVGDYKGPMNFYFRGDDDFWLFVDGELAIDLGGIHSAVGEAIDMRKWLETHGGVEGTHSVSVYFMERGGWGSCCYIQYTLPNCKDVEIPKVPWINLNVEKKWPIPGEKDFSRPQEITVQLLRKNKGQDDTKYEVIDSKVLSGTGDTWKTSWNMLPKVNPNNTSIEYCYKIQELSVNGYEASYESNEIDVDNVEDSATATCTITNTLSSTVKVEVEKNWKDNNNGNSSRPQSITMQLQYSIYEDTFLDVPGDEPNTKRTLTLNESNQWKGVFSDLPYYADKTFIEEVKDDKGNTVLDENGNPITKTITKRVPITYRVREVIVGSDGKLTVLEDNGNILPGSPGTNYKYMVTYTDENVFPPSDNPEAIPSENGDTVVEKTVVSNTLTTDMSVVKDWKGVPSDITASAKIGLFKKVTETSNGNSINKWELVKHFVKGTPTESGQIMTWTEQEADKPEDVLFEFAAPQSQMGTWKNIPKYDEQGNEIIYDIFEVDSSYKPIEILNGEGVITTTINGHSYEVIKGLQNSNGEQAMGSEPETTNVVAITNKYMVDLNIQKIVEASGSAFSPEKPFEFTAIVKDKSDQILKLPTPDSNAGYTIDTNNNGESIIKFTIYCGNASGQPGNKVSIPVPLGSTVTITEVNHAGYNVEYKIDNQSSQNGDTITVPIPDEPDGNEKYVKEINVVCTNKTGVVLPDTGGPGLLMMSRLGWMLLLLALLMAGMEIQFYGERRNRKAATVQREDTRGFDPDDY